MEFSSQKSSSQPPAQPWVTTPVEGLLSILHTNQPLQPVLGFPTTGSISSPWKGESLLAVLDAGDCPTFLRALGLLVGSSQERFSGVSSLEY